MIRTWFRFTDAKRSKRRMLPGAFSALVPTRVVKMMAASTKIFIFQIVLLENCGPNCEGTENGFGTWQNEIAKVLPTHSELDFYKILQLRHKCYFVRWQVRHNNLLDATIVWFHCGLLPFEKQCETRQNDTLMIFDHWFCWWHNKKFFRWPNRRSVIDREIYLIRIFGDIFMVAQHLFCANQKSENDASCRKRNGLLVQLQLLFGRISIHLLLATKSKPTFN